MSNTPSPWGELSGVELTKGQGTGNDFIFVKDPTGTLELDQDLVARACDRHFGFGADGFIRAIKTENLIEGKHLLEEHPDATWFMDYRNADGSLSEMCGNGVRAFIEYLRTESLIDLEEGGRVVLRLLRWVKMVTLLTWGRGALLTVIQHAITVTMPWSTRAVLKLRVLPCRFRWVTRILLLLLAPRASWMAWVLKLHLR